jgi:hypothetical protein
MAKATTTKAAKVVPIKRTDAACYLTEEEARQTKNVEWFAEIARERVPRARAIVDLLCQLDDSQIDMTNPGTPEKALEAARDHLLAVEEALLRFDELVTRQREVSHG